MKFSIYILLLIFTSISLCFSQVQNMKFVHISTPQGLSQSEVNCICQDHKGFIWIATLDGLNRYDGYDMRVFRKNTDLVNSISNNKIQSVFEDSHGNLWIGTLGGGLNKYINENENFLSFQHQNGKLKSIFDDNVNCINETRKGDILLGTQKGLSIIKYNNTNKIQIEFENYFSFAVNDILEDKNGYFWLATWEGLFKFKFNNKGIPIITEHYIYDSRNPKSLSTDGVNSLYQDKEGTLWIGTNNGLDMLSSDQIIANGNKIFKHYRYEPEISNCLPNNQVLAINDNKDGRLIIGTRGGGLTFFDKNNQNFVTYKTDRFNASTINNNSVKCLFKDKTGNLWVGTLGGGINKLDLFGKQFRSYEINLKNKDLNYSNFVRSIYEDNNNILWIGTLDGGLYTLDRKKSDTYYKYNIIDRENENKLIHSPNIIYGRNVFSIIEDNNNCYWIGTDGGINIINNKTKIIGYHSMDYNNPDSLISNSIFAIEKDNDGTFWIGTWGGLHHYIPTKNGKHGYFIRYMVDEKNSNSISGDIIRYIYKDPLTSDLWICTLDGGLDRIIKNDFDGSYRIIQYKQNSNETGSISSNEINMVIRTKAGDLWIATNDGLNKLISGTDISHCSFIKFKVKDGLSGNNVKSILEDSNGNLWLGTNNGLSKFNPATKEFNNYDESDGFPSNEFSEHACYKNKRGEMFFGEIDGFISFFPDSIIRNTYEPSTCITNLLLFNNIVPIGKLANGRTILNKSITETEEIRLSYKDNDFTIEFSSLHYASPKKNKFAYKLEGLNDNWIYTDANNRKATFTNLKGGTYIFKVKASNNDGIWQNNPTILKIQIIPPIWQTWEAYLVYLIILIILVYAIIIETKTKENLRLEVALKNLENEKAEEINQIKIKFFTNISHEFRTPLTLIISPIENILSSVKGNTIIKEQLNVMYRNAKYLLKLINELMDFSKMEVESIKIYASKIDLITFTHEIISNFHFIAEKRNIKFNLFTDIQQIDVWIDKEILIKIINNLIYNAFKFTPDGGQIDIKIERGKGQRSPEFSNNFEIKYEGRTFDQYVSIIVKDSGIGISSQSIQSIFNRYYQVSSSDSFKHLGSGIGLAYTKNLVLLCKGEIKVASERYKGTEFIVRLPLGDGHLSETEKLAKEIVDESIFSDDHLIDDLDYEEADNEITDNIHDKVESTSAPLILVVEDNKEMRHFIKSNLEKKFRVLEANNGLSGFELAVENVPDLVVSDVIMPEMNGIELCKRLKKDIRTSHIPLVLLTALASINNQIEGLEVGADDYISKPFNYRLFEIRIENLIHSRKRLRERFSKEIEIDSKDYTLNWRDQEFLDKAINLVKIKISDPDLNVNNLCKEIGMSRMNLHRKITALTDQTPSDFIRTIRLKEAAHLLTENRLSISEIAYKVGFSAPSYFTTCFGKQFGLTPKEYMAKT